MKLKELPISLITAWRLRRLTLSELHKSVSAPLPVIVSLTSIPSRLGIIHLTIRSLLVQSVKPEKIILWLNHQLSNKLPSSLSELCGSLFEIRYVDLECSHRKLIHSLAMFPEKLIVTCDDDLMYDATWLARLYQDHLQFPADIIAHECRTIAYDSQGEVRPYADWKLATKTNFSSTWLMPIGFGGVLYPPRSLHEDVQKRELFLRLAPRADDLWFKAMSHKAGTATRRSSDPGNKPIPIAGSQKVSLKKTNVRQDGNYLQWCELVKFYQFDTRASSDALSAVQHSD